MAVGAVALLGVGCGTGADARHVRAAAEQFSVAARRHDGPTACAQLSPSLCMQLVRGESDRSCAKAVLELKLHGGRIASARVYATSAQVQLVGGGDTMFLSDSKLGWRIEALGCGPTVLGPLACEAQLSMPGAGPGPA